jgi:alkylation response protein AidB-like acyl-CoA dehydrogenase
MADDAGVRAEVRAFLRDAWDPDLALHEWRGRLADAGWACPSWPEQWLGRGLPVALGGVVAEELAAAGAVGPPPGAGLALAGPTILEHGSDDLRRELLRPTVTGEAMWCQLFSEPGSGSDLAGLTTRAERDGDRYVVNGQKVWTTSAHHARYGMLLARTDPDVPKHRGITYFVLDMAQPGVEVRPLRQANGHASFNEVFLTDAVVSRSHVVGEVGNGWAVALATLAHERRADLRLGTRPPGERPPGRCWAEAAEEAEHVLAPYRWYPQRAGRVDLLPSRLQAHGRSADPVARQAVTAATVMARITALTTQRVAAARALGRPPGPEGSLGKLQASRVAKGAAAAHALVAGAAALETGAGGLLEGTVAEVLVSVPAVSIAGGTDEIQHNILGERVLGLPKEPSVDAHLAFRDVRTNTADRR